METRTHSRAVAVCDAIALVAPLAVTLVAEGCVQAGRPQVAPRQTQATLVHVWTAGICPAGREGHRQPQALPHPQGAVTPTQRPREVPLKAPGGGGQEVKKGVGTERNKRQRQGDSEREREGKTETERQEGRMRTKEPQSPGRSGEKRENRRERGREEKQRKGEGAEKQAIRIRAEGEPHPPPHPLASLSPASPSQRGVVLIAAPAALMALQTLVAGQEAVAAPAPGL